MQTRTQTQAPAHIHTQTRSHMLASMLACVYVHERSYELV